MCIWLVCVRAYVNEIDPTHVFYVCVMDEFVYPLVPLVWTASCFDSACTVSSFPSPCIHSVSPFSLHSPSIASPTYTLSGGANAPTSSPEPPRLLSNDAKRSLALAEREALELRLAEKARDEREYEEDEEEEEKDRQPDLEKDDMMARRAGTFQKGMGGASHNRFLPLPASKRDTPGFGQTDSSHPSRGTARDPQMLERNITTKRYKIGQRWAYWLRMVV